ncbi:glycoside hydrolase family 3 N-terminal domain-containing protein [Alicyclobacillus macrosporangiidus]|uniref:Beta-glucosidase n=1 Tax=Alicyclobacillus macrosporangiidus TaxID=392015 RepID=A0A1I7GA88_9BACL|nr:glycoside hydrolase family 3 N-terminal domain-containing protein [Alicyclobacillus macrosporangiidus]SFU45349.1 beta-glucosidase [Alicyclobacillus macrosporangiidus]
MTETYRDAYRPEHERVADLLPRMSLEEKVAQLSSIWAYEVLANGGFDEQRAAHVLSDGIGQVTRIAGATNLPPRGVAQFANALQRYLITRTRLGIPAIVHEESCSGFMARGATCFPQAIGLASTWDRHLIQRIAEVIRTQIRAAGGHQALAPLLDVTRDPRWGRVEETFGEDPQLVAELGIAYIKGLQGEDGARGVLATGKHFVGYGASEGGMNWAPAHLPERELREVYMYPFEAAIKEARLAAIMPGYHELDGVPCHWSSELLQRTLRERWGFDGIVVSDYFAVNQLFEYHRVAQSKVDAAVFAVQAGVDVELPSRDVYGGPLLEAVRAGRIRMEEIDALVTRILLAKFRLGLFEHPYVDVEQIEMVFDNAEQRALAREAARKSLVLLKNEDDLLPLRKDLRVAVIGPNADSTRNLVGDYAYPCHIESLVEMRRQANVFDTPLPEDVEAVEQFVPMRSILSAMRERLGADRIVYAEGCDILGQRADFEAATDAARRADVAVVVVGDRAGVTDECTTGEARDRATLGLLGHQEALVRAVVETGTPTVVVVVSGRPLALPWIAQHVPGVLMAWLPGEEGADAVADVLFGDAVPGGKLPISMPRSVGQLPVYYRHKPSGGRSHWKGNYVDELTTPLYPFGHGLSYTKFVYTDLAIAPEEIEVHGTVQISCVIENAGRYPGDEVVQLYIRDGEASVTRPVKELKGFARVSLAPGERARVTFRLSAHQLAFYDRDLRFVVEPGTIQVLVGSSSEDIRLTGAFRIHGSIADVEREKVFSTPVTITRLD